jgi:radical SAM superfamily enzyme YgiQ (UPF0313 family)
MKKILLATPKWTNSYPEQPPLSLLYLASWLRQFGHKVWICDEPILEDFGQMLNEIKPDVVGINSPTCGITRGYSLAKYSKDMGYYTVMGGPHVSALPEEPLHYEVCDSVVVGEGELALQKIVETKEKGIIKGEPITDLDKVPIPAFDLINMDFYVTVRRRIGNSLYSFVNVLDRCMSLMSSRGCPFKCCYCYNSSLMYDTPVRYKTPEKTVEEFKLMEKTYKVNAITFLDDDFVLNKKRLEKICELLQDNKTVYWGCNSRVTDVNKDMLEMLTQAGCVQLAFGIESGNPRILKDILKKQATVEQAQEAVRLCHEFGVVVQSNFMIGNPTETEEEMMDTLRFMRLNKIDGGIGTSATIPFPNTGIWKWCVENKKIPEQLNWEMFNYSEYPINMSNVSDEDFVRIRNKFADFLNYNLEATKNSRDNKVKNWKAKVKVL